MGLNQSSPDKNSTSSMDIRAPKPVMAERTPYNIEVLKPDGTTYTTYIDENDNLNDLKRRLENKNIYFYPITYSPTHQQPHQGYLESIHEGKIGTPPLFYTQPIHLLPKGKNNKYEVSIVLGTPENIELEEIMQKNTLDILIIRFQLYFTIPIIQKKGKGLTTEWLKNRCEIHIDNLNKLTNGKIVYTNTNTYINQYELLNKLRHIVDYAYTNGLIYDLMIFLKKAKYICQQFWTKFQTNYELSNLKLDINLQLENEFYFYYDRQYAYRIPHTAMVLQKCLQLVLNKKLSLDDIQKYGDNIPTILDNTYDRWKDLFNDTRETLHQLPELSNIDPKDYIYLEDAIFIGNRLKTRPIPDLDEDL